MTNDKIFEDVKKILIEEFEADASKVTPEASFYEDLELDSLDAIDLIVNISNLYDIDISNKSIEEAKTVQQLIDMLQTYLNR